MLQSSGNVICADPYHLRVNAFLEVVTGFPTRGCPSLKLLLKIVILCIELLFVFLFLEAKYFAPKYGSGAATETARGNVASLGGGELKVAPEMIKEVKKCLQREGTKFGVVPLDGTIKERKKLTVICRTQLVSSEGIEVAAERDIEGCLQPIMEVATFYGCGKILGTVERRAGEALEFTPMVGESNVVTVLCG